MFTVNQIRQTFLNYFKNRGHTIIHSSSLVPHNDPTLLFTNAGMNQFKNVFVGLEEVPYKTAASSQKCVRAGGKHNDLDNVGYTARHHTFFEMLGNFSFGDYFKEQAIYHAWQMVTKEFALDPKRLLVTVYHDDDDAVKYWRQIAGFNDSQIIRIATSDNFWSMSDTGPCGPCSEIFYDHGEKIAGGIPGSPEQDGDRYTEIWNLVFMQFNQQSDGTRQALPRPSIDTGAGLERLASVLQGVHNNYDIDLFQNLIHASQALTTDDPNFLSSQRVIADHLRASCFLIADGVLPSNEGRGYVLRRIMRRAMRHAYILKAQEPLMYKLAPTLLKEMGDVYPELMRANALIVDTLKTEEERFRLTLGRGLKLLEEEMDTISSTKKLPGETAFKLYDTYGFPLDLTQDILRNKNLEVDTQGFQECMRAQKELARQSWQGSGEQTDDSLWFDLAKSFSYPICAHHDDMVTNAQVQALVVEGKIVDIINENQEGWLIVNKTSFYAESGGQVGDIGKGWNQDQTVQFDILDTQKKAGTLIVHHIRITKGYLKNQENIIFEVDSIYRNHVKRNHSATHLLHAALRHALGEHVSQKGSLVNAEKLRFDFNYGQSIAPSDLQKIEDHVNEIIRLNVPATIEVLPAKEAIDKGALALFGEKYAENVRVITMGTSTEKPYSIELCGGTHISRTGDIGYFKIVSQSGLAAGVRRIEAVTGKGAELYVQHLEHQLDAVTTLLKCSSAQMKDRITSMIQERKVKEQEIKQLKDKISTAENADFHIEQINSVPFLAHTFTDLSAKDLRTKMDTLKSRLPSGIMVLGTQSDGKAAILVSVSPDLLARYNAIDLIKLGAQAMGGQGGGGRPEVAQAGGPNGDKLEDAYRAIKSIL